MYGAPCIYPLSDTFVQSKQKKERKKGIPFTIYLLNCDGDTQKPA